MLDETALRRETFVEGVPIVLADGQSWVFPKPEAGDFYFARRADGTTYCRQAWAFGEGYNAIYERYVAATEGLEAGCALADLAYDLLSRNYDLSFDDCRSLFRVVSPGAPGRDVSDVMWEAIAAVAVGKTPKP